MSTGTSPVPVLKNALAAVLAIVLAVPVICLLVVVVLVALVVGFVMMMTLAVRRLLFAPRATGLAGRSEADDNSGRENVRVIRPGQ
ncbi:MAG: hypothetical protein SGJ11_02740 [Phycisphaerae bacterium]|nr:hypothetical protein [Phycisphaerae bacterium]